MPDHNSIVHVRHTSLLGENSDDVPAGGVDGLAARVDHIARQQAEGADLRLDLEGTLWGLLSQVGYVVTQLPLVGLQGLLNKPIFTSPMG